MAVKINWVTPDGDEHITYMARVSNPDREFESSPRLLFYLLRNKHWSPFEMANACVEITTTRDVSRQILRHRSFQFQEFSGRYAPYKKASDLRECRLQDKRNRQNSLQHDDAGLHDWWKDVQQGILAHSFEAYEQALEKGVAKEVARAILPEGLTPTTMHMNGTLRSWIHYWQVRCTPETQKEHRLIAEETRAMILPRFPIIREALEELNNG